MRQALRLLVFVLTTAIFGLGLYFTLLGFGIYVLGSPTPECADSGTCDTYGRVLWEFGSGWPAIVGCTLLSGAFLWPLFRASRYGKNRRGSARRAGPLI
jgi:hypothetical protein